MIQFNSKIKNGFGFLSNFYKAPFTVSVMTDQGSQAITFNTVEGFYQLCKHPEPVPLDVAKTFATASGEEARRLGRTIPIVINWHSKRIKMMSVAIRLKFIQNPGLMKKLKDTGREQLLHVSPWDLFWGGTADGQGKNVLGKMLMALRDG